MLCADSANGAEYLHHLSVVVAVDERYATGCCAASRPAVELDN